MIKQKNIFLFFTLILIFINTVTAKHNANSRLNQKNKLTNHDIEIERGISSNQELTLSTRNQNNYFLETFDYSLEGWTIDDCWNTTDINFYSSDYSITSFDNNQALPQLCQITSPTYLLPEQSLNESIHYSFWLRNDMLDGDGDGDSYLDDFFSLSLLVPSENEWNTTNLNSYDGRSYWCGNEGLNGYGDTWVQYLDTPEVLLQPNSELNVMMKWAIENADGAVEENIEAICGNDDSTIDGWDQANVQISIDGGSTWDILIGSEPYDFQCGYGAFYNGFIGLPGWSGIKDWHDVTFGLSDYANQNVIVRFAFYSDPSWSSIDDETLTGFQIDNIQIATHGVTFEDNADANSQMIASGENWKEQLYDYWDDGTGSGNGLPQPGCITWEEYKPGTAFEGNILQNLTEYAGKNIKFRFQTFFDGNNDGGLGSGLFIDDFRIYSESTEFYPPPSNLISQNSNGEVKLTWSNSLNYEGQYLHILDSGDDANFDETTIECGNSEDCITYMGNLFYIHGNSSVDSIFIYNKNDTPTQVDIAGFSTIGELFNPDITYNRTVILTESNAWNGFAVDGWNFTNPYIIAHTITDEISISLETQVSPYGAFFNGSTWDSIENGYSYYTTGIRAKITKEDSDVTYNIYRIDGDNSDFIQLASSLIDSTFIDNTVIELQEYIYGVSATYPENNEESEKFIQPESISILPSTYQELYWDDGIFESSFEVESDDSLAVKFSASNTGQKIVRFKWYQVDNGGYVRIVIWGNSENGTPNDVLYNELINQTDTDFNATAGWNEYDLSGQDWLVSGDFWIGLRFYGNTSPIAIDYDVVSNSSMLRISGSEWSTINDWNLGFRVFLDCASENVDECGVCDGDNSSCLDCNGDINGTANYDNCTIPVCSGGETEFIANATCTDCAGVLNGDTETDECGVCGGSGPIGECGCGNIPIEFCDCSENIFDECDICGGDGSSCLDDCGVPNGNNLTCTGCMDSVYEEFNEYATIPCEDCCSQLGNDENFISSTFEITNLFPNPFNPQINIEYILPTRTKVNISIYNIHGQEVDRLLNSVQNSGYHSIKWIANDQNSGIYFIQIIADNNIINRKIMYLK